MVESGLKLGTFLPQLPDAEIIDRYHHIYTIFIKQVYLQCIEIITLWLLSRIKIGKLFLIGNK